MTVEDGLIRADLLLTSVAAIVRPVSSGQAPWSYLAPRPGMEDLHLVAVHPSVWPAVVLQLNACAKGWDYPYSRPWWRRAWRWLRGRR